MSNTRGTDDSFVRGIGPLAAISLVMGSMIGSGIFIVPADISRQLAAWGPAGLLAAWIATGLVTMAGALAYAELAAMLPQAGGQYVYLREGLSPAAGFLYGWTLFTVIQTGTIAAVGVGFAKFLGVLVPWCTPDIFLTFGHVSMPGGVIELGLSNQRLVAIGMILVLSAVNMRGVVLGASIQTLFTLAKIGAFAALIGLGVFVFRNHDIATANATTLWGAKPWSIALLPALATAMVGSLFSSDAWNNVTFAAAEVREPAKNLPRALALGTFLVTMLYVLANVSYLSVLPFGGSAEGATVLERGIQHATQDRVATAAFEAMIGPVGATIMAIAILVSTFGCNNGLILSGSRVYYAMAKDGLFFARAGRLHPTWRTPVFGLILQALWASLLCLSGTYSELLNYVVFAALIFYLLTTVGLFRLRFTRPDLPRPVKAFGYPVLPALYIVALAGILVALLADPVQRKFSVLGLGLVALGVPVYALWRRSAAASA
jgi:APA family basic amino acid/polyamine antiporter